MYENNNPMKMSPAAENINRNSPDNLLKQKKTKPETTQNETRPKEENSPDSPVLQIEKVLRQAEKCYAHLRHETKMLQAKIKQAMELSKNLSQRTNPNIQIKVALGSQKNGKVNHQNLELLLNQRLKDLDIIQKNLYSPNLMLKDNPDRIERVGKTELKKILIVDDDPTSIKLTSYFTQNAGYAVTTAFDGNEGLEKALENPPDIILIDLMMPGMDGFQLLARLKKESATSRVPVVILSSLSNEQEIIRGLKEGAVDFITKPFSPQVLLAKLEKCIDLKT